MRTMEEIQKDIDFNADAQRAIKTVKNELTAKIADLERQKADIEAEKPEIQHGDFGVFKDGTPRIIAKEKVYDKIGVCGTVRDDFYTIFGNIFKIMEGWGEDDLEDFKKTGWGCGTLGVRIVHKSSAASGLIEFEIGGQRATFDLAEAMEVWVKFGAKLMFLKKQQK